MFELIGFLLIICGLGGVGLFVFFRVKGGKTEILPEQREVPYVLKSDREMAKLLPTDTMAQETSTGEKLNAVKAQQTVTLLGDKERAVQASIALHEMTQNSSSSPWRRTGVKSSILVLSGNIFIAKIPSREAGKPKWFKVKEIETFPLEKFWKDGTTTGGKGPARVFKESGQSKPVPFTLPNNLTPNINWEVVDIGRFECQVDGKSENFITGDMYPFVTSCEINGQHWLLSLESRKGMARGSGGLFIGELFEPAIDVEALL